MELKIQSFHPFFDIMRFSRVGCWLLGKGDAQRCL
jgi:hypothetical protein